jgi:hypothetical protein
MNRYNYTTTSTRWDGKRVYNTLTMPNIPFDDSDIYIISQDGMYLDQLAYNYYKDPTLWWIIAQANNLGKGRLSVPVGLQLRIPTNPSNILSRLKTLNS